MSQLKPIKFPEATKSLAKPVNMTDEECNSLWVYTHGYDCISCWKLTIRQRLAILFHGTIWLGILSGYTQPPVWLDCRKKMFKQAGDGNG